MGQDTVKMATEFTNSEVDQLLLNARLRDELEPFLDESVELVDVAAMSTARENEFLASMLQWERAPALPISHWFEPELELPPPDTLSDAVLSRLLWDAINRLADRNIVLEYTDHLSDRELYAILYRDILPSTEKRIDKLSKPLRWRLVDSDSDPDAWLTYYANDAQRYLWELENGQVPPPHEDPPFPRDLPK